ncbi:MAG: hypothetical protein DMG08_13330 [Acidobacteria bacterium]|nr:MAG: hypothetical protein DMG08_13330 [Acidobacteriota bacterium]PYV04126.1 MAG: hypothetical protein DMG10_09025 [Acidobacteriota bacterium]PYV38667.1 MAG: hypothetical protein DMG09_11300 [Acidobacteriota bacterium]
MTKQKTTTGRFGELAARHRFALNPHVDYRASRCPGCARPTRRRKFVLSIGVVPGHIVAMGKDCRYCPDCDVIIAHQDELEDLLAKLFADAAPEVVGNDYVVLGLVERRFWRQHLGRPADQSDFRRHVADFRSYETISESPSLPQSRSKTKKGDSHPNS